MKTEFSNPLFFEYQEPLPFLMWCVFIVCFVMFVIYLKEIFQNPNKLNELETWFGLGIGGTVFGVWIFWGLPLLYQDHQKTYAVDDTQLCIVKKVTLEAEHCADLDNLILNWEWDSESPSSSDSGSTFFRLTLSTKNNETIAVLSTSDGSKISKIAQKYAKIHVKAPHLLHEARARKEFPASFINALSDEVSLLIEELGLENQQ